MRGTIKIMRLTDHSLTLTTYRGPLNMENIKVLKDDA